jgi:hypothetical protein
MRPTSCFSQIWALKMNSQVIGKPHYFYETRWRYLCSQDSHQKSKSLHRRDNEGLHNPRNAAARSSIDVITY